MTRVRTPCVGVCTATSLGDPVCRGCGRRDYEVIQWNTYTDEQKRAILDRIQKESSL